MNVIERTFNLQREDALVETQSHYLFVPLHWFSCWRRLQA